MGELAFEVVNRHRAYAELVIHHRNWLPAWFICWYLDGFSDHGERFLRGEAQPPSLVRAWWHYKHWRLRRWSNPSDIADRYRRGLPLRGKNPPIPDNRRTKGGLIKPSIARPGNIIPLREGETIKVINFDGQPGAVFIAEPKSNGELARECGYDPPWTDTHFNNLVIGRVPTVMSLDGYEIDADLLSHQLAAAYHDGAFPQGPFYYNGSDLITMLKRGGPDFIAARQIIEGLRFQPTPPDFPPYKKTGRWHERLQQEVDKRKGVVRGPHGEEIEINEISSNANFNGTVLIPRFGLTMEQAEQAFRGLQSGAIGLAKVTDFRPAVRIVVN